MERTAAGERDNTTAMQDAGVMEITTSPDAYARYLEMQGDNPAYSARKYRTGHVQRPGGHRVRHRDRWKR